MAQSTTKKRSTAQAVLFNLAAVIVVCVAGVVGWYLSGANSPHKQHSHRREDSSDGGVLQLNVLGQIFGYICAVLYLGSRIPQLLLNYRRENTEGVSMLFFAFACIGNITYVISVLAYEPECHRFGDCAPGEARSIYARYFAVNLSWLIGSFGTLLLDAGVFVQYFMYKDINKDEVAVEDG